MALATLANNNAKILFSKNFINKAVENIFYLKPKGMFLLEHDKSPVDFLKG